MHQTKICTVASQSVSAVTLYEALPSGVCARRDVTQ